MASRYRQHMQRAWSRIAAIPTGKLQTRFGTVEYAERGAGRPILTSHGVFGCHADGVDGWWTRMLGEGFWVIAPSRFGYFGSTLAPDATPADQADAYALLLDHLGIDRTAILGYSAGSASALEFTRRHPDRTVALILVCARLGGPTPRKLLEPVLRAVYGWERGWWIYRRLLPSAYARMVGRPQGLPANLRGRGHHPGRQRAAVPAQAPKAGRHLRRVRVQHGRRPVPFEELTMPTLIVSAVDDPWAPYAYAVKAAARIPGAKLEMVDRGGHLFLSHDAQVRSAIGGFIESMAQQGGRRR